MYEQRRCRRGATRKDQVRAVLRLDAANALDDVRPKALERPPFQTFRTVSSDIFCCRIDAVRHRTARSLWPEARPDIVGSTAKQQIEATAIRGENCISASGGPIGRGPVAVGEIAVIGGALNHAVQRDMFHDPDFPHDVSFGTGFQAPAAGAVNTIPTECSTEKTRAPRTPPVRRRRPYVPTPVPRPYQRLAVSKDRLRAPWSPDTARR